MYRTEKQCRAMAGSKGIEIERSGRHGNEMYRSVWKVQNRYVAYRKAQNWIVEAGSNRKEADGAEVERTDPNRSELYRLESIVRPCLFQRRT